MSDMDNFAQNDTVDDGCVEADDEMMESVDGIMGPDEGNIEARSVNMELFEGEVIMEECIDLVMEIYECDGNSNDPTNNSNDNNNSLPEPGTRRQDGVLDFNEGFWSPRIFEPPRLPRKRKASALGSSSTFRDTSTFKCRRNLFGPDDASDVYCQESDLLDQVALCSTAECVDDEHGHEKAVKEEEEGEEEEEDTVIKVIVQPELSYSCRDCMFYNYGGRFRDMDDILDGAQVRGSACYDARPRSVVSSSCSECYRELPPIHFYTQNEDRNSIEINLEVLRNQQRQVPENNLSQRRRRGQRRRPSRLALLLSRRDLSFRDDNSDEEERRFHRDRDMGQPVTPRARPLTPFDSSFSSRRQITRRRLLFSEQDLATANIDDATQSDSHSSHANSVDDSTAL